ncbi:NUDIX domain-containing protein [Arthrospiribacter ruber]|uniref:NUDIX hydrolase n=1 Tax=Arthrospiribacter ruber TaxID=2487934 RepID=A0A951MCU7_9BACT|nr:NUDIX hydrolase [Arthrospiribacter ruber]MBW3467290.1 NUDIX hydrolase [Arthrospiribacter ruber]
MAELEKELTDKFGGRLRIRVNGILIEDGAALMIKHRMGPERDFWNVPGGGMKFGSDAAENLKREFKEETGLDIRICNFVCAHEYLETPLHAIELFFLVEKTGGRLTLGTDPELDSGKQLITELKFMTPEKLQMIPKGEKHPLFDGIKSWNDVRKWMGYFNFENNSIK